MSTFDFVRPSGIWPIEAVPGANDMYGFDWRQARLVNGDGGAWSPALSPITVGGAGLQLASAASKLVGGLRTTLGGRLVLGPLDVIALSPPRTITRTIDLVSLPAANIRFVGTPLTTNSGLPYFLPSDACFVTAYAGSGAPAAGIVPASVESFNPIVFTIPTAWILNGRFTASGGVTPSLSNATLAAVTLNFRCIEPLSSLPASMMQIVPASGLSFLQPPIGANSLNVVFPPGTISAWLPIGVYTAGQYVIPQANRAAPFSYFKAVITGSSGVSNVGEPNWNLTPGSVTFDTPSLSWLCIGPTGDLYAQDTAALFNQANPQSLTAAMDPAVSGNIDETHNFVTVTINNYVPATLLHSLQFTFNAITQRTWT